MLILPFIHGIINNDNNNFQVNVIKVLTIGGQTLWEEDNSLDIDNDILNPNDIYRKGGPIKYDNNLEMYEVDTNKTNISQMYHWNECTLDDSNTFCWRTFYYFTNNNVCWLDIPNNEKLGKYSIKELIEIIIRRK